MEVSQTCKDVQNFLKCISVIKEVSKRTVPCIEKVITDLHVRLKAKAGQCQQSTCPKYTEPKDGVSCDSCIAWAREIDSLSIDINWVVFLPDKIYTDPVELGKLLVCQASKDNLDKVKAFSHFGARSLFTIIKAYLQCIHKLEGRSPKKRMAFDEVKLKMERLQVQQEEEEFELSSSLSSDDARLGELLPEDNMDMNSSTSSDDARKEERETQSLSENVDTKEQQCIESVQKVLEISADFVDHASDLKATDQKLDNCCRAFTHFIQCLKDLGYMAYEELYEAWAQIQKIKLTELPYDEMKDLIEEIPCVENGFTLSSSHIMDIKEKFERFCSVLVEASESDLADIVKLLGADDLKKLFNALCIKHCQVEKAEKGADTKDVELQAAAVLRCWKKEKGRKATRIVILEALESCGNIDAKDTIEQLWKSKGPFTKFHIQKSDLEHISDMDGLLTFLEDKCLLSPNNLLYLQLLLSLVGEDGLVKKISNFARYSNGLKPPLTLEELKRKPESEFFYAELHIDGQIEEADGNFIEEYRERLAKWLRLDHPCLVKFIALDEGSIIILFELPITAKEDLREAVLSNAHWLDEAHVISITLDQKETIYLGKEPCEIPGTPRAVDINATEIVISWTPPESDGGSPIIGYTVECKKFSYSNSHWMKVNSELVKETTLFVTGLVEKSMYRFRVIVEREMASGPASKPSDTYQTEESCFLSPPGKINITNTQKRTVLVTWLPPETDGGSPVKEYVIEKCDVSQGKWIKAVNEKITKTSCTVTDLIEGNNYQFRVSAKNMAGLWSSSEPSFGVRVRWPSVKPDPPTNLHITKTTPDTVTLVWVPPIDDGGSPVIKYVVERYDIERSTWTNAGITAELTITVPRIFQGNNYMFRVSAFNINGWSKSVETSESSSSEHQTDLQDLQKHLKATYTILKSEENISILPSKVADLLMDTRLTYEMQYLLSDENIDFKQIIHTLSQNKWSDSIHAIVANDENTPYASIISRLAYQWAIGKTESIAVPALKPKSPQHVYGETCLSSDTQFSSQKYVSSEEEIEQNLVILENSSSDTEEEMTNISHTEEEMISTTTITSDREVLKEDKMTNISDTQEEIISTTTISSDMEEEITSSDTEFIQVVDFKGKPIAIRRKQKSKQRQKPKKSTKMGTQSKTLQAERITRNPNIFQTKSCVIPIHDFSTDISLPLSKKRTSLKQGQEQTSTIQIPCNYNLLARFELVFSLDLKNIQTRASIIDFVQKQLTPSFSKQNLYSLIFSNAKSCLFLLNGSDNEIPFLNMLDNGILHQCHVIYTGNGKSVNEKLQSVVASAPHKFTRILRVHPQREERFVSYRAKPRKKRDRLRGNDPGLSQTGYKSDKDDALQGSSHPNFNPALSFTCPFTLAEKKLPPTEKNPSITLLDKQGWIQNLIKQDGLQTGNLRYLDLSGSNIGSTISGVNVVYESIHKMVRLRHLDLSSNNIENVGTQKLFKATRCFRELRHLDLSCNNIGAEMLSSKLYQLNDLRHLDLSSNEIRGDGAIAILSHLHVCDKLEYLDMSNNQIGKITLCDRVGHEHGRMCHEPFWVADDDFQYVHRSCYGSRPLHPNTPTRKLEHLKYLNLSGNNIQDNVSSLSVILEGALGLRYLDLSRNTIRNSGAKVLAALLGNKAELLYLDLSHNMIADVGAKALSTSFCDMMKLRHLDLSSNQIQDSGAKALSLSLCDNVAIRHLDLSNNMIADVGAKALSISLCDMMNLRHLDLSSNQIEDSGAKALSMSLCDNVEIGHLDLSRNDIGEKGVKAVSVSLPFLNEEKHLKFVK